MRSEADVGPSTGPERAHGGGGAAPNGRVVVPLVDEQEAGRIYDRSFHRFALLGGLLGAVGAGAVGWLMADGALAIAGLGQFAASGTAPAAFVGVGIGLAVGALTGASIALYRLPARHP